MRKFLSQERETDTWLQKILDVKNYLSRNVGNAFSGFCSSMICCTSPVSFSLKIYGDTICCPGISMIFFQIYYLTAFHPLKQGFILLTFLAFPVSHICHSLELNSLVWAEDTALQSDIFNIDCKKGYTIKCLLKDSYLVALTKSWIYFLMLKIMSARLRACRLYHLQRSLDVSL